MSETYQLVAEDVSAMRKVGSYFGTTFRTSAEGESQLTLTIGEHDNDRIYTVPEQKLFNVVDHSYPRGRSRVIKCTARLEDFGNGSGPYMAYTSWVPVLVWKTIAQNARVGDVITLHWQSSLNGSEGALADAGFHTDRLTLILSDPDRKRPSRGFVVANQTSPNNTARMVQRNDGSANLFAFKR